MQMRQRSASCNRLSCSRVAYRIKKSIRYNPVEKVRNTMSAITLQETSEQEGTPVGKLKEGEEGDGTCVSPA